MKRIDGIYAKRKTEKLTYRLIYVPAFSRIKNTKLVKIRHA